jgi:NRAMP (natural resistance-associated macrophage protein)-like metal ion transporter
MIAIVICVRNLQVVYSLWFIMEVAIAATDLAEVIGSAVSLNLLFHIPIWGGVLITGADVLFIIIFGVKRFRLVELLIIALCLVSLHSTHEYLSAWLLICHHISKGNPGARTRQWNVCYNMAADRVPPSRVRFTKVT